MEAMDFDALTTKGQEFNTLDNVAQSATNQSMTQQVMHNIRSMQVPMPQGHIPQHVVLPVFKRQDNESQNTFSQQVFVAINGSPKGPLTIEQLKGLVIAEVIDDSTQVWMPGMASWSDLKTCLTNLNV